MRQAIAQARVGGEFVIRLTDVNNRGQRLGTATVQEAEALMVLKGRGYRRGLFFIIQGIFLFE